MEDDGLHGDSLAGDGIYGAKIPPTSFGTTVMYNVKAADNIGTGTATPVTSAYTVTDAKAAPITATPSIASAHVILRWNSQAGLSYSVQLSDGLILWNTTPVGSINTWEDTGSISTLSKRFYRVTR